MIFKRELAEAIMRGEKTATRRQMSDNPRSPWYRERCAYKVEQVFTINPGRGVTNIGRARVTCVCQQPLGKMQEEDARREGFRANRSASARLAFGIAWAEINGSYDPAEVVWVVEFEVVK